MKKKRFAIIFLAAGITHNSYSAEPIKKRKKTEAIIIQNMQTSIRPYLAALEIHINLSTECKQSKFCGLYKTVSCEPLINFWKQEFKPCTSSFHLRFCPTIILYNAQGVLENLGNFNDKQHGEAKRSMHIGKCSLFSP